MEFDIQRFLSEMRAEQQTDHKDLSEKVDNGFQLINTRVSDHETRLTIVEGTRTTMRWIAGAAVMALLTAAAEFFFVLLPKLLSH